MNWLLLLTFLSISCSKNNVNYDQITTDMTKLGSILAIDNYNKEIEIMLLFLWPKNLDMSKSSVVTSIISKSKTIMVDKQSYLKNKKKYESLYIASHCECVLYYDCTDDLYEANSEEVLICENTELDIEKNNDKVLSFFQKYELIKKELQSINANFYFIGVEKNIIDIGYFDFINNEVIINEISIDGRAQQDVIASIHFADDLAETKLKVFGKELSGELDIIATPYNLTFQGEIESSDGMKGMMYWEHLK